MNSSIVRRPPWRLRGVSQAPWSCCHQNAVPQRRNESSFRRTVKRLRVKPDATFLPSPDSPQQDHIVFNPPSSAPSVYHTPLAFLPRHDRRRDLLSSRQPAPPTAAPSTTSPSTSSATTATNTTPPLPKPVRQPHEKKYHLGTKEIEEIRRLRLEKPHIYTSGALAKKFDCSRLFVTIICQAPAEQRQREDSKLEAIKSRWGRKRREAREDRAKRRDEWGREET